MFARAETIKQAISTVKRQACMPIPRSQHFNDIYKNRSEWVDSCARICGVLEDVLKDVEKGDTRSLSIRYRNTVDSYKTGKSA